ncbi:hypothetical protein LINPERPRIM_LOCUS39323 [Linum perenne]
MKACLHLLQDGKGSVS